MANITSLPGYQPQFREPLGRVASAVSEGFETAEERRAREKEEERKRYLAAVSPEGVPPMLQPSPAVGPATAAPATLPPMGPSMGPTAAPRPGMPTFGGVGKEAMDVAGKSVEAYDQMIKDQKRILQDQADLAEQRLMEENRLKEKQFDAEIDLERKRNVWEIANRKLLDKATKNVEDAMTQDPDRWKKTKVVGEDGKVTYETSIAKTVGAALLVGLGEFAKSMQQMGGIQGARNLSKEIIDDKIERDLQAQKAEGEKAKTLLAENIRRTGSESQAWEISKAQLKDQYVRQLDKLAGEYKGEEARQQASLLANAYRQEIQGHKDVAIQKALAAKQQSQEFMAEQKYKQGVLELEREKVEAGKGPKLRELPASEASELGGLSAATKIIGKLSEKFTTLKKEGWTAGVGLPGSMAQEYNDAKQTLGYVVAKLKEGGKMSDKDAETLMKDIPDATEFNERGLKKLENAFFVVNTMMSGKAEGLAKSGFNVPTDYLRQQPKSFKANE